MYYGCKSCGVGLSGRGSDAALLEAGVANRLTVVRVALPTLAIAATTSGIALVINYATAWRNNLWAWVAVGVLTLLSGGLSVWVYVQQQPDMPPDVSRAGDSRSNELIVGPKGRFRRVQLLARERNRAEFGANAEVGTLQMVAGLDQVHVPGGEPEPAAIPDEDGGM